MCGIGGVWQFQGTSIHSKEFDPFIDSMAHRGPDGRGTYFDANSSLFLGHRRLSILDLSESAKQPMSYANQRFWITYNGEIYNFLELKRELEALGHKFSTDSDTEIILASYAEWKDECQYKFNGMWAFAIWDTKERILFLSRDRFGVKPLYYSVNSQFFAFASEMKAFRHLKGFDFIVNEQIIADTIYNVNATAAFESTWIQNVKSLPPGCFTFCNDRGQLNVKRWWNTLDHLPKPPKSFEEQESEFRTLFLDACRIRLRSDVPIATALSGGLDSSSVLAGVTQVLNTYVDRCSPECRKAYTVAFPNTSQDESIYARQMAEFADVPITMCKVDAFTLTDQIDRVIYDLESVFDLPIGPWMLYKKMREDGRVISLDGHGPDEMLGGYHHHVLDAMITSFPFHYKSLSQTLKNMYPIGSFSKVPRFSFFLKKASTKLLKKWPAAFKLVKEIYGNSNMDFHSPKKWLKIDPIERKYEGNHQSYHGFDSFERSLYIDFHQRTMPSILRNFDRASMAHGVEIRAPFLDWRLVCYGFALHKSSKMGQGYTKRILREAMKGMMPEGIRTRTTKIGFANPVHEWLKSSLRSFVLDSVHSQSFQSSSIWDGPKIAEAVENGYKNQQMDNVRALWEFILADRLIQLFSKVSV